MDELPELELVAAVKAHALTLAVRDQRVRDAIAAGSSIDSVASITGEPRAVIEVIVAGEPLTDQEYLRLSTVEMMAAGDVICQRKLSETLD